MNDMDNIPVSFIKMSYVNLISLPFHGNDIKNWEKLMLTIRFINNILRILMSSFDIDLPASQNTVLLWLS